MCATISTRANRIVATIKIDRHTPRTPLQQGRRGRQTFASLPGPPLARKSRRWGSIQPRIQTQVAGQFAIARQPVAQRPSAVGGISQQVKPASGIGSAQQLYQLQGQFRTRAVDATVLGGFRLVEVQAKENRQAEAAIRQLRKPHDNSQDDPTMSPTGHRLDVLQQRVMVPTHPIDLLASLPRQRVIDNQEDGLSQEGLHPGHQGQPQRIQRPMRVGRRNDGNTTSVWGVLEELPEACSSRFGVGPTAIPLQFAQMFAGWGTSSFRPMPAKYPRLRVR